MQVEQLPANNPATLVAIVIAARRSGDRELERIMRRELEEHFSVKLRFAKEKAQSGGDHGK